MLAVRQIPWRQGVLAPAPLYLDASVLVGYWVEWLRGQVPYLGALEDQHRQRAAQLIADHVLGNVPIQVSHLCLDESLFQLMKKLSALTALLGQPRASRDSLPDFLVRNPQAMSTIQPILVDCVQDTRTWSTIIGARAEDADSIVDSALDRLHDVTGVRDAFHLAVVEHVGSGSVATADRHFTTLRALPRALAVIKI